MTSVEILSAKLRKIARTDKDPKIREAAQKHADGLLAAWNAKRGAR